MQRMKWSVVCLFLVALLSGCSGGGEFPTSPVKGKVTYKGKALPTGTVMFVPDSGPPAYGNIDKEGNYTLGTYGEKDGAVMGKHKVSITALEEMGDVLPEARSGTPPSLIPDKYSNIDNSGLTFEVKSGDNEANFELQ